MRRDTLEGLYRAHYRPALLYTLSLCGDPAQAEDIVAAAFETALLTLEEGSPGFRYWLLKVCRHRWLDEVRRGRRRHPAPPEDLPLTAPDDVLEGILQEERYAALYRALAKLPERPRELLTLHYFGGLPLARVGELAGLSPGAAKTALCRARQRLRQIMEEDGYEV